MFSSQIYCVTFVNHRCTGGFTYFTLHFIHATFCIEPRIFEAGYEESEIDLRVEFELLPDGKWYVVDCYTGWYGYDLPIAELKQTIQHVQEENAAFKELHP